jgi:PAS domain S-box-containing protein
LLTVKKIMEPAINYPISVKELSVTIHLLNYPAWIFDEKSLRIMDANTAAINFCMYNQHELMGLSITDLWHDEDLADILDNLEVHGAERSFFGNLKHKKKNGEIVRMRVRATRINTESMWVVHLISNTGECKE